MITAAWNELPNRQQIFEFKKIIFTSKLLSFYSIKTLAEFIEYSNAYQTSQNILLLVRECYDKLAAMEKKLVESESCHADKIEKGLLKNLLIGYIVAPNQNDKLQILKLISSVLDFNQTETDKVGLNKTHTSWLNSLIAGTSGSSTDNGTMICYEFKFHIFITHFFLLIENYNKQGLAEAFVKFLEKESQPRTSPPNTMSLLNIVQKPLNKPTSSASSTQETSQHLTTPTTPSTSVPAAIQPILLTDSIMQNFAPPRNSSSILKDILNDS